MQLKHFFAAAAVIAFAQGAFAQTNVQTFYDFGNGRNYITTTFEMFKGDAQRGFHRGLFVGAPTAPHPAFTRERTLLDVFGDFGRRRAGIGVNAGKTGVQSTQGNGLIAQKQSFFRHNTLN